MAARVLIGDQEYGESQYYHTNISNVCVKSMCVYMGEYLFTAHGLRERQRQHEAGLHGHTR
jgi:hypothetical protein